MAKTYNVMKINVKDEITSIITAKEEDLNSRYLDVYLMDDGIPINLTGHEVRIYGRKPDGTEFFNDGEITDAVNGRCQFPITSQALAVAGNLKVELSIWQNNERILTTQTFDISVVPKIRNDKAIESSNEFGALVILFQKLYDFIADVTELLNLVGQPADTGGTTLEGTVMAKINRLMSVAGTDNAWKIKSLQHGIVAYETIGPYSTSNAEMDRYIEINPINIDKAILLVEHSEKGIGVNNRGYGFARIYSSNKLAQLNYSAYQTTSPWKTTYYYNSFVYYVLEFE